MKKVIVKMGTILIITMMILGAFIGKSYAANKTTPITSKIKTSQKVINKVRYNAPKLSDGGSYYGLSLLRSKQGIFCLDHTGSATAQRLVRFTSAYADQVTKNCQKINYILGCQEARKDGGNGYKSSLAQNYIWKVPKSVLQGTNIKQNASSNVVGYDYKKIEAANTAYNEYAQANSENSTKKDLKNFTYAQVANDDEIKYTMSDDYLRFVDLKMNDYTYAYSLDCSYVNKTVKYNQYGDTKDKPLPKRAGVLAGIVEATVTIKSNGKTEKLNYSAGDFEFTYTGGRDSKIKEKYKYYAFPTPGEKFNIKIAKGKLSKIDMSSNMTVTVKFQSIKVKADEITSAKLFKQDNNASMQPMLAVSAGMKTFSRTRGIKFTIKGDGDNSSVSIKTYITEVKGGGEGEIKNYHYQNETIQCRLWNDEHRELSQASRATWSEQKKYDNRAVVEEGDTVTFTIKIKNNSKNKIEISDVHYTGCASGKLWNGGTKKLDPGQTITAQVEVSGENITKEKTENNKRNLTAQIGKVKNSDKKPKSADYFTYKNYYVTVDKYIDNVNGNSASLEVSKGTNGADTGDKNTDDADTLDKDDEIEESINDKPDADHGDDAEKGYEVNGERVYLGATDTTKIIGVDQRSYYAIYNADKDPTFSEELAVCYLRVPSNHPTYVYLANDRSGNITVSEKMSGEYKIVYQLASDQIGCYEKGGKYYYNNSGTYIDITSIIRTEGADGEKVNYFDLTAVPGVTIDPSTIEAASINHYYYFETDGGCYIQIDEYIASDAKGKYFDKARYDAAHSSTNPSGWDAGLEDEDEPIEESDTTSDDGEVANIVRVYLKCDASGNIAHGSEVKDKYYYPVEDRNGHVVCYQQERFFRSPYCFIYDEETKNYSATYASGSAGNWYIDIDVDDDKTYLETDSSGNIKKRTWCERYLFLPN